MLDKDKVVLIETENDKWAVTIDGNTYGWITKWYDRGGVVNKTAKSFYSAKPICAHYSYNYFNSQNTAVAFIIYCLNG